MTTPLLPLLASLFFLAGCSGSSTPTTGSGNAALSNPLDLSGRPVDPFAARAPATVLIFLSPDCPISNRYSPDIQQLAEVYQPKGAAFWLVYPDPSLSPETIQEHLNAFGYKLPALRDPSRILVRRAGAEVTPEAAVFNSDGRRIYHGRIDNRFVAFGKERPAATEHDLRDAVEAALAGKQPVRDFAKPVGCYLAPLP